MINETEPSELFFIAHLTLSIVVCSIGLIFCCLFIFVVIINKPSHTITNLLICNNGLCTITYTVYMIFSSIYGLRGDWLHYQPACIFRGYFILASCSLVTYSYLIQAVSRLFFIVFYNLKYLQTYRIHYILIILNWSIGLIIPCILHLINNNVARLVANFRFCGAAPEFFIPSLYIAIAIFCIPFGLVVIIYTHIFLHIYQSKRLLLPFTSPLTGSTNNAVPNMKREIKLMKITMILWTCFAIAGLPYLLLILWPVLFKSSAPKAFYLISVNSITISSECMMIAIFFITRDVKNYLVNAIKTLYCI